MSSSTNTNQDSPMFELRQLMDSGNLKYIWLDECQLTISSVANNQKQFLITRKLDGQSKAYTSNEWKLDENNKRIEVTYGVSPKTNNPMLALFYFLDKSNYDKAVKFLNKNEAYQLPTDSTTLSKSFERELKDQNSYTINKLHNYIVDCVSKWNVQGDNVNRILAPIVLLTQSSGYGKSKSLFEFAKNVPTVFICLRQLSSPGYPERSKIADTMITALKSTNYDNSEIKKFLLVLVKHAINELDKVQGTPEAKAQQLLLCQPWMSKRKEEQVVWSQEQDNFTNAVSNDSELKWTLHDLVKSIEPFKQKLNSTTTILIIAIDEAQILSVESYTSKQGPKSLFRRLRKAIIELFKGWNISVVLTSTNTSLAEFHYGRSQMDESARAIPKKLYKPFAELIYCDQLLPENYLTSLKDAYKKKEMYTFIQERDPVTTIFFMGRPMWAAYHQTVLEKLKDENEKKNASTNSHILALAKAKLILAEDWSKVNDKQCASLAVLSVSTCLLSLVNVVKQKLWSDLVARFMATLANIDDDCDVMLMTYVSEPILSEAAANYMSKLDNLKDMLRQLLDLLTTTALSSTGSLGEFVAEILMLGAKNSVVLKKQNNKGYALRNQSIAYSPIFSMPVTAEEYLKELINSDNLNKCIDKNQMYNAERLRDNTQKQAKRTTPFNQDFLKGAICFSHFAHQEDPLSESSILQNLVGRCAGARLKDNTAGFDSLLTNVLENGRIGVIGVQVKNVVDATSSSLAIKSKTNIDTLESKAANINLESNSTMIILFNLASSDNSVGLLEDGTVAINGICKETFTFLDEEACDLLKALLNCSRTSLKNIKGMDDEYKRRLLYGKEEPNQ